MYYTVKLDDEPVAEFLFYQDAENYARSISDAMDEGTIKSQCVEIEYPQTEEMKMKNARRSEVLNFYLG